MEEEQITYARSHTTTQPPPTQAARQTELQYQQKHSNYIQRKFQQQQQQQQSRPPPIPNNVIPPNCVWGSVDKRNLWHRILRFGETWILLHKRNLLNRQRNT